MLPVHHAPNEQEQLEIQTRRLLRDDTKAYSTKIAVFQYFAVGVFLFLMATFWDLQVRNPDLYHERADQNSIKSIPVLAPRGKLLDRDGRVIVDNHSSFTLMLSRVNLKEEHLADIARGLGLEEDELRSRVRRFRSRPNYERINVKNELTHGDLAFVEAHRDPEGFPEMELIHAQRRLYPLDGLASHVIGHVGEINEVELNLAEFARYEPGDVIGKAGIERFYNELLMGIDGKQQVIVDNHGRERATIGMKEASPGRSLQLTIDLDLQVVAELVLEKKRGAVVALDPRNGEVLAMASRPAFDPNKFAGRIRARDWNELRDNPEKPLLNRAIQAALAPGSTFKPLVAWAGLESGILGDGFTVQCSGGAFFYGRYFKCHQKKGHGRVDLQKALVQSCDVFFYVLGNRLGIDTIAKYAERAGLGRRTGIDLPAEAEGLVPSSEWKMRSSRLKWYAGETISVSIGQGALQVTPLQLAHAIGGLVVGGEWHRPHLVRNPAKREPPRVHRLDPDHLQKIVSGLFGVVNQGGTGASGWLPGIELSGKTGTAQLISNELQKTLKPGEKIKDNAWFVGFAPRQAPEIVVVALFEEGEHGPRAAPMVRDVIKAYFDKKARQTPPRSFAQGVSRLPGSVP